MGNSDESKQIETNLFITKIRNEYILRKILDNCNQIKKLKIIKYNKII